ncbi:MAG: phosphopentomutase [Lachnospiraceae bacterium]|nr:phosphopentomutase [Lachnospiraceae bacterium]MBQ9232713.1 phosphopentomutase [Lachnospiraceae bacterium]
MGRRVIWIVLDSAGAGEMPDADKYGDAGADTFGHILKTFPDARFDNMSKLGLFNIDGTSFNKSITDAANYDSDPESKIAGCYGKASEMSNGKDTTTGHWEMIGLYTKIAFPTYPDGFPKEIIDEFIEKTGCGGVYGNKVASGTVIIQEYGDEHMKTGYPIVYTSADSVFQIAASEEKVGLERLYEMCETARAILQGRYNVGRVIARPFITTETGYERTTNRRDYALPPDRDNVLVHLEEKNIRTYGVGKIGDIFDNVGISEGIHTNGNTDGMNKTMEYMEKVDEGLIFTNLVDFDMKYGHRRDVTGYKNALEEFDAWLGEKLIPAMTDDDIVIINADHGCDPTFKGTDHTREYIPVLIYGRKLKQGTNLGIINSFADIGKTIEEYLIGNVTTDTHSIGESFLGRIIEG